MGRSGTTAARCIRLLQLFLLCGAMTSSEAARLLEVPIGMRRSDRWGSWTASRCSWAGMWRRSFKARPCTSGSRGLTTTRVGSPRHGWLRTSTGSSATSRSPPGATPGGPRCWTGCSMRSCEFRTIVITRSGPSRSPRSWHDMPATRSTPAIGGASATLGVALRPRRDAKPHFVQHQESHGRSHATIPSLLSIARDPSTTDSAPPSPSTGSTRAIPFTGDRCSVGSHVDLDVLVGEVGDQGPVHTPSATCAGQNRRRASPPTIATPPPGTPRPRPRTSRPSGRPRR